MAKKKKSSDTIQNTNGVDAPSEPEVQNATNGGSIDSEQDKSDIVIQELQQQIKEQSEKAAEHQEAHIRALAEIENLKKRNNSELTKARNFAVSEFARSMLDVMESLDQALENKPEENSANVIDSIREGVDLTRKQLLSAFEKAAITKIDPKIGDEFDANLHQAMTVAQTDKYPPNRITTVYRPGYTIHDRLLRPAMVIVSSAVVDAKEEATSNALPEQDDSEELVDA